MLFVFISLNYFGYSMEHLCAYELYSDDSYGNKTVKKYDFSVFQ